MKIAARLWMKIFHLVVATTLISTSVQAQNYPWCAMLSMGDQAMNCGFISSDQCMASVRGIGGFCMPNNAYQLPRLPLPRARSTRTSLR